MAKYLKIYTDAEQKYQKLSDAEFGRLIRAGLHYKETGEEIELTGRESLLWDGLKLDIDRDNEKYDSLCTTRSEAGKRGAAARWQNNGKNGKSHLPYGKNGQDKDKDEDKDKDKDEDKDYIPPLSPNGDSPPAGVSKKRRSAARDVIDAWTQDPELRSLLYEWLDVRKAQRAANTEGAIRQNLAKLPELAQQSGLSMQDYMREIICRSWRAFYPIRDAKPEPRTDGRNFDWMTGH